MNKIFRWLSFILIVVFLTFGLLAGGFAIISGGIIFLAASSGAPPDLELNIVEVANLLNISISTLCVGILTFAVCVYFIVKAEKWRRMWK